MHTFYVPQLPAEGGTVTLDDDEARHIRARRLRPGEAVKLIDGAGNFALGTYKSGDQITADRPRAQPEPATALHLIQAWLPAEKLDWVLQKSVEMGASSIVIFQPERSAGGSRRAERTDRWERLIREAAKQCGQARFPRLEVHANLADALANPPPVLWMMDAEGTRPDFPVSAAPARAALLVGPEGGLSPEEKELALQAGAVKVRLGPWVLRSETVAAAGLALLQYGYGSEQPHSETNPSKT
jgi:16S rRNA (uracil1498-N3)-methyltransferase